ncbi:unnamed protein product [Cylindrotheca closterium]|uniref:Helicase-associated domain-containing protein n=1 Tax=Cylindrotheca closterium TaxID=2856 RepID=A0AAD2JHY4_9STRA|nr:unnamed protein product [Cylindrotheca closterium]
MDVQNSSQIDAATNAGNGFTMNQQQQRQHKSIAWSNCDAAAAATASSSETLLNHMRNTLLNSQVNAAPSARQVANAFSNTHQRSSGFPSLTNNPFTQSNPQQLMIGSIGSGLPSGMNFNGNIFDHPLIKNPALQPTPIQELKSNANVQGSGGRVQPQGTLSLLDESLEALLKDESFGLGTDDPSPLFRQDPAAFVFPKDSLDSMQKRLVPTGGHMMMMPDNSAKRQRTGYEQNSRAPRFRPYQEKQWQEQFEELLSFKEKHGHCLVPHSFEENQTLSRWVKRQRYQYKLMKENKVTTMTASRVVQLEEIGFIWDSHAAAWQERLGELEAYLKKHGDSHVPSNYPDNPQLATWVKCQRRQGKLYFNGRPSNMTNERVAALNRLGFSWGMRHGL